MREIPLKNAVMTPPPGAPDGPEPKIHYSELIAAVLKNPPIAPNGQPIGFDIDQQRNIFKVLDAVDAAVAAGADKVKLEEPEYGFVKARLAQMKWAIPDRAFILFTDEINDAPLIDPNAVP